MCRLMLCRKLGMASLALGVVSLVAPTWFLVFAAQPQEQQQSPPPPPPPVPAENSQTTSPPPPPPGQPAGKQHKVWTNDEVVLLRTPADSYLVEKEAREAREAEAAAKSAAHPKAAKEVPVETRLPSSIEETQLLIKNKEQDIRDDETSLASLNTELANAPDEQKKAKQKEIAIVAAELDRARNELKVLEDHLVELHKPAAGEPKAAPPPPN
jgi:hypothetical protein